MILSNGKIITMDSGFTIAEAIAIGKGGFQAVGSNADIQILEGPDTERIDLKGKTVLPGLIDSHTHMDWAAEQKLAVPLGQQKSVAEALAVIKEWVGKKKPGEWIIGSGAFSPLAQLEEKRFLTRWELDKAAPHNPVCLPADHMVMYNSYAMRLSGIRKDTPDPPSGTIERDPETGEPNGVLVEAACHLVKDIVPPWPFETRVVCYKEAMKTYNSGGLTSIVNGITTPESLEVFEHIWNNREATIRVSLMYCPTGEEIPSASLDDWDKIIKEIGRYSDFGDDWLNIPGIKFISDGGMTLRTAYLREPYPDDSTYYGSSLIPQERLNQLVAICNRHNWRVGIHAVGDAAIDKVLDAYEFADKEQSIGSRRFIVLHASLMLLDQMERAKKLGVIVAVGNSFMWLKASTTERYLGKERANRACPTRWMIDYMGIENVGPGPDFPINPFNPFIAMYVMVTRKDSRGVVYGGNQAITREEALRLYTNGSARYTFEEDIKGSIEPGKLADLVVISDDILTCPEEAIKDIKALITMVDGKIVHQY